jgi:hypothetical protein
LLEINAIIANVLLTLPAVVKALLGYTLGRELLLAFAAF